MSGEICSSNNGQHSQFRNIDLYYRPVDSHDLDLRLSMTSLLSCWLPELQQPWGEETQRSLEVADFQCPQAPQLNKSALFQEGGFDRLADLRRENEHLKKESIQKTMGGS